MMGCLATDTRRFGAEGDGGRNALPRERMARRKEASRRGRVLDGGRVVESRSVNGAMFPTRRLLSFWY